MSCSSCKQLVYDLLRFSPSASLVFDSPHPTRRLPTERYPALSHRAWLPFVCIPMDHPCLHLLSFQCRPSTAVSAEESTSSDDDASTGSCSEDWGQCGGIDWAGPTCCSSGVPCSELNEFYSQCVPGGYA